MPPARRRIARLLVAAYVAPSSWATAAIPSIRSQAAINSSSVNVMVVIMGVGVLWEAVQLLIILVF